MTRSPMSDSTCPANSSRNCGSVTQHLGHEPARAAHRGSGPPASATTTPAAPASEQRRARPRAAARASSTAAPASTANCHASLQRRGEQDGRAEDRPDRGRAGAVEERAHRGVAAQAVELPRADEHEHERRRERDRRGQQRAAHAGGGVADGGDRVDDRARRDLAERDRVRNCVVGHPPVAVDRVALHQRDDHEAAAVRQRADLERDPRQRAEPAGRRRGARRAAARRARRPRRRRRPRRPARRRTTSTAPQPSSTSTSHGPIVAAASRAEPR